MHTCTTIQNSLLTQYKTKHFIIYTAIQNSINATLQNKTVYQRYVTKQNNISIQQYNNGIK